MTYNPRWVLNGLDLTASPFLVPQDEADPGTAETVSAILASMIADGDIELTQRRGNRTYELPVMIEGSDRGTIATAQADLVRAAEQVLGTLEFDPGDGSDVTVFETFAGSVSLQNGIDDVAASSGFQRLKVTIPCRPFVRTVDEVTIDAPAAVGSTTTVVDSGSATTGWSLLSTAPSPLKNLISNPSFETNTTGWAPGTGSSGISRFAYVGGEGITGAGSYKLWVAPTLGNARVYVNSPAISVAASTVYTLGAYMNGTTADRISGLGILYRWYDSGGAQIGTDQSYTTGPSSTTASMLFKRVATVATSPAGAATLRIYPFANYSTPNTEMGNFGVDGAFVTTAGYYFDGNTTDTAAINYAWDGTANNSTTTGTWTTPTLAVVSGAVKGTVYGRASASIRRTGAVTMTSLPYMRIRGTASAFSDVQISVADNGGAALSTASYSYNATTGAFEILVNRPAGFTTVDVTASRTSGAVSTTDGLFIAVDSIEITDNPFGTGKVQSRQVSIFGSQRTELSLSVLGLDATNTPVALGEQTLVHTASTGGDSRAKFLGCRVASGLGGTSDANAVSGFFTTLSTTTTPTVFTFLAATLLPGEYVAFARLKATSAATRTISFSAALDGAGALDATDPVSGWYTAQVAALTSYRIFSLGSLMLPPASIEDPAATLSIKVAADTASVVQLDEIWIAHVETGQVTLLDTNDSGISAIRLDAATVDRAMPSVWVGVATATGTGTMMFAGTRIQTFEQHMAEPGLLQISTVTPGCATSRVSAQYYPRFAHDVASLESA